MTTFPGISSNVKNYSFSENAFLPREVTVPLVQEKKIRCMPIVKEGDFVSEGDVIAVPESFSLGAKIHSPIPGVVIGIFTTRCPNGRPEIAIKIKLQGKFSFLGKKTTVRDWDTMFSQTIMQKICDKGVVNSYYITNPESLAAQIDTVSKKKKKALVVRMFDEDPVRITDSLVTKFYADKVKKGAYITAKALRADGILYVFGNDSLKINDNELPFELGQNEKYMIMSSKKYPSGFKDDICAAYKKNFKKEMDFSVSKSDLFVDSSTMYEVCQSIESNLPVINKLVHFSGNCIPVSCLLNVKVGMLLKDAVKQLGGFIKEPSMIIVNGHLTGYSVQDLNVPITKYVKSIAFVSKRKSPDQFMYSCISCGNCRALCIRNIMPDLLYLYKSEHREINPEYIQSAYLCVDCGLCNSVCPARIPLTQIIASIRAPDWEIPDDDEEEEQNV